MATAHDRLFASLDTLTPEHISYAENHGGLYGTDPRKGLLEAVRNDLGLLEPIEAPVGGLPQRIGALQELATPGEQVRAWAAKIDHTKPQWGMSPENVMRFKLDGMQEAPLDQSKRQHAAVR